MHEIEQGKNGGLAAMRDYLQEDCDMLQIWAGKTDTDDDFILFMSKDLNRFAVLFSEVGSRIYTVQPAGDVIFVHDKNMKKLGLKKS